MRMSYTALIRVLKYDALRTLKYDLLRTSPYGLILPTSDASYQRPEDVPQRSTEEVLKVLQVRLRHVQEIRASVFGLSINKCYITKMASTAQQIYHTKRKDMNYVSKLNNKTHIFLSSKILSNSIHLSSM